MTPDDFKTEYPAFAAVANPVIQLVIDRSAPHFDVDLWGDLYPEGVGLWVAHSLTLKGLDPTYGVGSGSSIVKKVGDVSITRSTTFNARTTKNPYDLTTYGQRYRLLAETVGGGVIVV